MSLLLVDRQTIRDLLPLRDCIDLMRQAMVALSAGETRQTLRQIIPLGEGTAFGVMPGSTRNAFGAKLISVFPANFAKGLQSHQGLVSLFDPQSGAPIAILHAGEITAIRTAAASAAATDALARSDASRLAILGYGEQAVEHARAMVLVRSIGEIRVWGRSFERADRFARRTEAELGVACRAFPSAREAVLNADIVCAVTAAREPILLGGDLSDGAHVNLVGSGAADAREADDALVVRGRLFADHREGVLRQGGEVLHAVAANLIGEDHVLGEIGAVISGVLEGRRKPSDLTIYKSLGAIAQDLEAAWSVYRRALAEERGVVIPF